MNKVVHFRVLMDWEKDVFRDIEISLNDNFYKLHEIIQEAFGFDNSQMASFYVSNDNWEKGQEITLADMSEPGGHTQPIWLMHETAMNKIIFEKGQKLVYVFDFMLMWCFFIDVINVTELDNNVILPRIRQTYGAAPDQYGKSPEIVFDAETIDQNPDDEENLEIEQLFRVHGMGDASHE